MRYLLLQHELHQLFCRWTHILKTLTEWYDREPHSFQILHHLNRSPPVESNLFDMIFHAEIFDKVLNVSVVDDIAFRGDYLFTIEPSIVWNVVTSYSQIYRVFWYPKVQKNVVFIVIDCRLIESQLSEQVLFGRVLFCRVESRFQFVYIDCNTERRVDFVPHLLFPQSSLSSAP